jgi:hypothetical protein
VRFYFGYIVFSLSICLGMQSCNDVPATQVLDSVVIQVEGGVANTAPLKLDILWVVDNSVSMCQEQNSLAANIKTFTDKFESFDVDLRMAVVTTDALSKSEQGTFHHELAPHFPPNCLEKKVTECLVDDDCAFLGEKWVCEAPSQGLASNLTNLNGSINSQCRYLCDTDTECQELLDEETAFCFHPGGDQDARGCLTPPLNEGCPESEDLPEYVSSADGNLDIFPCLAIVGALQTSNPQLEQGLNTALWALDKNPDGSGPSHVEQAKHFVRTDAYQIIIFVSDEDDCSLADVEDVIVKEKWQNCACLGSTDIGGPLVPVSNIANKLKAINPDPSRVLVAAIVGDVISDGTSNIGALGCSADEGEEIQECIEGKQDIFMESKCGKFFYSKNSFVCESTSGIADWGSRYLELVERFKSNGFSANICNDVGFGPALEEISTSILTRVVHICLPQPVKPGSELVVTKTLANGVTILLYEGVDADFVRAEADCSGGSTGNNEAIFFNAVLDSNEEVHVRYEAPLLSY